MLKIIADQQIPQVQHAFAGIADIQLCDGRRIGPDLLVNTDVLLVRSVTRVDRRLLQDSPVRYVATATSGTDHIDLSCLREQGIGFSDAHGSNARAVAEYVLSALFVLAEQQEFDLFSKSIGIIGCGRVGGLLSHLLAALDIRCILNDPPLAGSAADDRYRPLAEVLEADIISLHVPFTDSGRYPTKNLIDADILARLPAETILINSARGGVIDEAALLASLSRQSRPLVVDVWQNEPVINPQLLAAVDIGTPHIAGYSLDAKLNATAMLHDAVCRYFSIDDHWLPDAGLMALDQRRLTFAPGQHEQDIIAMAVKSHYDVRSDAAALRRLLELETTQRGPYFDELRRNYPVRREFVATSVELPAQSASLARCLQTLGFSVTEPVI